MEEHYKEMESDRPLFAYWRDGKNIVLKDKSGAEVVVAKVVVITLCQPIWAKVYDGAFSDRPVKLRPWDGDGPKEVIEHMGHLSWFNPVVGRVHEVAVSFGKD